MQDPETAVQTMVHIESLRKSFGSNEVLKGITLDVAPGEVVGQLVPCAGCRREPAEHHGPGH